MDALNELYYNLNALKSRYYNEVGQTFFLESTAMKAGNPREIIVFSAKRRATIFTQNCYPKTELNVSRQRSENFLGANPRKIM